jgi:hypothetical protein
MPESHIKTYLANSPVFWDNTTAMNDSTRLRVISRPIWTKQSWIMGKYYGKVHESHGDLTLTVQF